MQKDEAKVGDLVMLNSGGPRMTITEMIGSENCKCVWSDYNQMPQQHEFPIVCVRKIVKHAGVIVRVSESAYQEVFEKLPAEHRFVNREQSGLLFNSIDGEHSILIQSVAIEAPESSKK